jgi:alpha-2-macroglobulin
MKKYLTHFTVLAFILNASILFSQVYKPLYFRLIPAEAEYLYRNPTKVPDSSFFHSKIDGYEEEEGHYLSVTNQGELAEVTFYSIDSAQIQLLNNHKGLAFLFTDDQGKKFIPSKVFFENKQIPFNPKTQCFQLAHAPKEGLLKIETPTHQSYFRLGQTDEKDHYRKGLYYRFCHTRVGWILTWPIRNFISIPVHYVKRGIKTHQWSRPWRYWFPGRPSRNMQGYIALNQPMYRHGDTLKIKAFVSSPNGRPLKENLQLQITQHWGKVVYNKSIRAETPGRYILEWPLKDSLLLDQDYNIEISYPGSKNWKDLNHTFRLEDYELDEIKYELKASNTAFHRGEKCILKLSAKTINALPVPDAEANVYLLSSYIKLFHADSLVVPDTLWHSRESLGARGEWNLVLPDSIIPAVSAELFVHVNFINSSGQLTHKEQTLQFWHTAALKARNTPQNTDASVSVSGLRSSDSIHMSLINPRKTPVWFQVKTRGQLITEGFFQDSIWAWEDRDLSSQTYHLYYQYLWQDEIIQEHQSFEHYEKALTISFEGPDRVIPGQEVSFEVKVNRGNERPAKGVDLSAGAINAQFGEKASYTLPNIGFRKQASPKKAKQYYEKPPVPKYQIPFTRLLTETFQVKDSLFYLYRYTQQLLQTWLDTSMKKDTFYRTVAQFAPFLVKGGKMQPIYLIYANRKLVYYYDTQDKASYSFAGLPGYNQITLRTLTCEYILDSVFLRKGEKLELVINEDYWKSVGNKVHIRQIPRSDFFTKEEKLLINQSIFAFHEPKNFNSWLRDSFFIWDSSNNIHFMVNPKFGDKLGPFSNHGILNYVSINNYKKQFLFEPGFAYSIEQNRERLYAYTVVPELPKNAPLQKVLPLPKLRQHIISPSSIRLQSPVRSWSHFDAIPSKKIKLSGRYQLKYPTPIPTIDSLNLSLIVVQNLEKGIKWILQPTTRSINHLTSGEYELLLFNSRKDVFRKKIVIKRDTLIYENLTNIHFQKADSLFWEIIKNHYAPESSSFETRKDFSSTLINTSGRKKLLQGKIVDENGEPLIGASILVKQTSIGTVTDVDGTFSLEVPIEATGIVVSYVGYTTEEIPWSPAVGSHPSIVTMKTSANLLSEVVVTGYSVLQSRSNVGSATTIIQHNLMGRVAGVAIATPQSRVQHKSLDSILSFPDTSSISNAIRKNFHDHAFWQPRLRSNRYGEAQFKVKFPDDITNWKVFVIGADKRLQAGLYQGNIQSYKPLMAQLATPRFLIQGDQTTLNGKVLNYTNDTFSIHTYFQVGDRRIFDKTQILKEGLVDRVSVEAPAQADSLHFTYALETSNGYLDGEQRSLPVLPVGTKETEGIFLMIERDTVLDFSHKTGQIKFRAEPNTLALLLDDIQYLRDYPFGCNEQTASKLMGLLSEKQIRKAQSQPLNNEKLILEGIARLSKGQNENGSWGWWPNGADNLWMSNYVIQALIKAQQEGYTCNALEDGLRWLNIKLPILKETEFLQSLKTLILSGQNIDTTGLYTKLALPQATLHNHLLRIWIQQELGFEPSMSTFLHYRKLDARGGAFWEEEKLDQYRYNWDNNRLANTLLAYQIAKKAGLTEELKRIRLHLLAHRGYIHDGQRVGNGWLNTREVATVLTTILPELCKGNTSLKISTLQLSGALTDTLSRQTLTESFNARQSLKLSVKGTGPFFCTAYQESWNTNPAPKSDLFAVSSHLEAAGEPVKSLQFGKAAQLIAEVNVKQEGQYVMIEIPIPAGCSYGEKTNGYRYPEVHREYFPEKVSIFCEKLPIGQHHFAINLEPRFSGAYTLNPVRVEEMYFPVLYGRNAVGSVKIKP